MPSPVNIAEFSASDKSDVIRLLQPYFRHFEKPGAWEWEWKNTPQASLILCAKHENNLVGHYGMIGYDMVFNGQVIRAGKLEGSCLDLEYLKAKKNEHKDLLQANKMLVEEIVSAMQKRNISLAFGFPNKFALISQVRYGLVHVPVLMTKCYLNTGKLAEIAGFTGVIKSTLKNIIRKTHRFKSAMVFNGLKKSYAISEVHELSTGDLAFLESLPAHVSNQGITVHRSSAFIRWRFLENPNGSHRVYRLVDKNSLRLCGMFVLFIKNQKAYIEDWIFPGENQNEYRFAFSFITRECFRRKLTSVEFNLSDCPAHRNIIGHAKSFLPAVQSFKKEMVIYASDSVRPFALNAAHWLVTDALKEGA